MVDGTVGCDRGTGAAQADVEARPRGDLAEARTWITPRRPFAGDIHTHEPVLLRQQGVLVLDFPAQRSHDIADAPLVHADFPADVPFLEKVLDIAATWRAKRPADERVVCHPAHAPARADTDFERLHG